MADLDFIKESMHKIVEGTKDASTRFTYSDLDLADILDDLSSIVSSIMTLTTKVDVIDDLADEITTVVNSVEGKLDTIDGIVDTITSDVSGIKDSVLSAGANFQAWVEAFVTKIGDRVEYQLKTTPVIIKCINVFKYWVENVSTEAY